MSKITGDNIFIYTDDGLVAHSTSASLEYNHNHYELLPNSYSSKRNYGIIDWTVSGEFYYDTGGNFSEFIDRINTKEKVSILIVENSNVVKFGYGLISNISISSQNVQTVAFSIEVLGSSKLTQYKSDAITIDVSKTIIRNIDNQIYVAKLDTGAFTFNVYGSNGNRLLISTTINNETLVDFIFYDKSLVVLTNLSLYKINKNGYVEVEISLGGDTYSKPKLVFDSQGEYVAFLSDDNEVKIYDSRLNLYEQITSTNLLDYVQLSNGNYLLSRTDGLSLKTNSNVIIGSVVISQTKGDLYKSSNEDIYLASNNGLSYFNDLQNDAFTRDTVTASIIDYVKELEGTLLVGVIQGGSSSILFKGKYLKGEFTNNVPVGDGGAGGSQFEIDSNGVVYSVESSLLEAYVPLDINIVSDYNLPIVKFL